MTIPVLELPLPVPILVPRHIFVTPDLNRTWAKENGLSPHKGHTRGLFVCRAFAEAAFNRGVKFVTFWAASDSNFRERAKKELRHLFRLLKFELRRRLQLKDWRVAFHLCGDPKWFAHDAELLRLVAELAEKTVNAEYHITALFGYCGRSEWNASTRSIALDVLEWARDERLELAKLSRDELAFLLDASELAGDAAIDASLWTSHLPKVDAFVRTVRKDRWNWSDLVLPRQLFKAQMFLLRKCWPEVTVEDLDRMLAAYAENEPKQNNGK